MQVTTEVYRCEPSAENWVEVNRQSFVLGSEPSESWQTVFETTLPLRDI